MEPPAGFHIKERTHVPRVCWPFNTQGTTLADSEQGIQGTDSVSFDINLGLLKNTLQLYEKETGNPVEYVA